MPAMDNAAIEHPTYGPCLRLVHGASSALVGLRGGQVLAWRCAGREQLYLSGRSRHAPGASIRGGIPVIFPQFADHGTGPRHGFARTSQWTPCDGPPTRGGAARACVRLRDGAATLAVWPHRFELEQTITLHEASLDIVLQVRNTDTRAWSFSTALHSYWRIDPGHPLQLPSLADASFHDRSATGCRAPAPGPLSTGHEVERLYPDAPQPVVLREARSLHFASEGWPDLMVWNPGPALASALADLDPSGQDHFLCVEPLQFTPRRLEPGETWRARHVITAEAGASESP